MTDRTHCRFEHPGLAARAVFRRTGGVAALAVTMNGAAAMLALPDVARAYGIDASSADGEMLRLVGQSLRFVASLSPGDALPAEVVTGEASWQPDHKHQYAAATRIHFMLIDWLGGAPGPDGEALRRVAGALGLKGGGPAVAGLIEALTREVAFIEALRGRLHAPLQRLLRRLERVTAVGDPASRRDRVRDVIRLAKAQAALIETQLEAADLRTSALLSSLRLVSLDRRFLHAMRDVLFCELVDWGPILAEWETWPGTEQGFWKALRRLHRFLAARAIA